MSKKHLFFSLLFSVVFVFKITAQKVTVNLQEAEIETIFSAINKQTGYSFAYSTQVIQPNSKASLQVDNEQLDVVLQKLFKDKNISFEKKDDNKVVLTKKEEAKKKQETEKKQEKIKVKGKVVDENNQPLAGASVLEKGTMNGTIADFDGNFQISVNPNSSIEASFVAYITKEVLVDNQTFITIKLQPKTNVLDEIVLVGYTTKVKKAVTGAISKIKANEIAIAPVGNATTTLAGRAPGVISVQSSGQPGFDEADLSIRGFGKPLVIVDGVESNFNTLDPNTIESFTILKDASAAIYGARAGNGVILVTTKRGGTKKPVVNLHSSYTMQGITTMPKPVNAGQYAELVREAQINQGEPEDKLEFTLEEIEKYYNGTDPQYPNTNWYNAVFRDWAPQQNHNISVRGGSEAIKYYGFFGRLNQETMVKKGGSGYTRYNLVANIDAKINKNFTFGMNLSNVIETKKYPRRGLGENRYSAWEDFWNTQPIYPATLPDPNKISYAEGSNTGGAHITSNREIAGYTDTNNENINGTLKLNYQSDLGIYGGLFFNYNKTYSQINRFEKPVEFYTYSYETDSYNLEGSLGSKAKLDITEMKNRRINGQASLGYKKVFDNHSINLMSLYEVTDYNYNWLSAGRIDFITPLIDQLYGGNTKGMSANGSTSFSGRVSWVNRLSYDYKKRYFLDVTLRADGSSKFPKNKRWGYFPSISAAWQISDEAFMKNLNRLDDLKLRLSYGEAGNDDIGNFLYESGYAISKNNNDGISYLIGNTSFTGIISLGLANPNLTWENTKTYNGGIDFSFYNQKIYGELDVFYRERSGIIGSRVNNFPGTVGASLPPENLNSISDRGFELFLGTKGSMGELFWNVKGNLSWSRAKWMHYEEPDYTDPDQIRIQQKSGQWVDRVFGYKTDGLFTSQEEIDNLGYNQDGNTTPNSTLNPGDVKYVDINEDGIINWKDRVNLGSTKPNWLVGLNLNLNYKAFDFTALFQGALSYNTIVTFRRGSVFSDVYYNERWTPENNDKNALIPRIGGAGVARNSDFNIKNASYLRLKSLALGYTLPEVVGIDKVRLYLAGTNLLTFSKLNDFNIDPESPSSRGGLYYPQQKTISLGVDFTF